MLLMENNQLQGGNQLITDYFSIKHTLLCFIPYILTTASHDRHALYILCIFQLFIIITI